MSNLSNFFHECKYQMADISSKRETFRRAIAMGEIHVGDIGFQHIKDGMLPKGDALKLAEIAGIQGAKTIWQQLPLCHPLLLDHAAVHTILCEETKNVSIYASVSSFAKTGVEMEALGAVSSALLTLYDLTKPVEPALRIENIHLVYKEGGKKGVWLNPNGVPAEIRSFFEETPQPPLTEHKAAVVTLSDRAAKGVYEDRSGLILSEKLQALGCELVDYTILPDNADELEHKIMTLCNSVDLIITTGGTGLAPRDITPDVIDRLANYHVPGIGEYLRQYGAQNVPTSWLSRSGASIINDTLIVYLPGSPGGVNDGLTCLSDLLAHALNHVQGRTVKHHHMEGSA